MAIGLLRYSLKITKAIRKAEKNGQLSSVEASYLSAMSRESNAANETANLIRIGGAPNFLSAGLFFATCIWASGERAEREFEANAGQKLAYYIYASETGQSMPSKVITGVLPFFLKHMNAAADAPDVVIVGWSKPPGVEVDITSFTEFEATANNNEATAQRLRRHNSGMFKKIPAQAFPEPTVENGAPGTTKKPVSGDSR